MEKKSTHILVDFCLMSSEAKKYKEALDAIVLQHYGSLIEYSGADFLDKSEEDEIELASMTFPFKLPMSDLIQNIVKVLKENGCVYYSVYVVDEKNDELWTLMQYDKEEGL